MSMVVSLTTTSPPPYIYLYIVAAVETRGHFRNTQERERPPLEAATKKRMLKTLKD
jgi:hypothetical protein